MDYLLYILVYNKYHNQYVKRITHTSKESLIRELRNHLKNAIPMIQPRIKMLILMKKSGEKALSKRDLMESLGVSSQSIQDWRSAYKTGGIELLMSNGRKGKFR